MEPSVSPRKKKLLWISALSVACIGIFVGVVVKMSWGVPAVVSTTMNGKVSSNAPLSITFDRIMKSSAVRKAVRIEPSVQGRVSFGLKNFTFVPAAPLEQKGTVYTLTVSMEATTLLGLPLTKTFTSSFTVVDPPKVIFAAPQGPAGQDSKVSVIFDRPMRSLTTKDAADAVMPMRLEPSTQGTYRWIGTNAVQFTPAKNLKPATTYTITVPKGIVSSDGGETVTEQRFTFQTPPLEVTYVEIPRYPEEKLWISFNHDVDLASARDLVRLYYLNKDEPPIPLTLSYGTSVEYEYKDGKQLEKTVENKKVIDVTPASGSFGYDEGYWFEIKKGVMALEGSTPNESETVRSFFTSPFLEYMSPECAGPCAHPTPELTFSFHEPVNRASVERALLVEPHFESTLEYGKMCDPSWEYSPEKPNEKCPLVDNKNVIIAKARQPLGNNVSFTATLKLHELVKENGTRPYSHEKTFTRSLTTAQPPVILGYTDAASPLSYKQFCLFSNNPLNLEQVEQSLRFSPEYTKKEANGKRDIYVFSNPPSPQNRGICTRPQFKDAWGTEVRILLNPHTRYTISLPGSVEDIFGQRIGKDYTIENYTTGDFTHEDITLKLRQNGPFALITDAMKIPLVFETKNLEEVEFNICRLTPEQFLKTQTEPERLTRVHFTETGWGAFQPSSSNCAFYKKISRRFSPAYWHSVFHELDIKKELGTDFQNGIYYVNAASARAFNFQYMERYNETEQRWVREADKKVFTRPFMLLSYTDLHVALKDGNDKLLVWTTGLSDGQPRAGSRITLYDVVGAPILSPRGTTNAQGILELSTVSPYSYAIIQNGTDVTVARREWNEGISAWDFNLSWDTLRQGTLGYLYTDRPIYRPGHMVHVKGILRNEYDARLTVPEEKTIKLRFTDPNGNGVIEKNVTVSPNGTFETEITLDVTAPLGRWYVDTYKECPDGNECPLYASTNFSVEEYKAPEYKAEISLNKEAYVNGDTFEATVRGNYFFGAPLPNAPLSWSVLAQNYYFDGYTKEWFSFSDSDYSYGCYWQCPYEDTTVAQGDTKLDEGGHATIAHTIDLEKNPKTSKLYTLYATVTDASGRSVSTNKTTVVHRGEYYVGVRADNYITKEKSSSSFTAITVDSAGTPLPDKKLTATLVRIDWKSTKKKNVDGYFYWENEEVEHEIDSAHATTGADGKTTFNFTPPSGGYYRIRVSGTDGKGNTIMSSTGFYASSYEYINWRQENNNRMELKLDKTEYAPGDTAHVLVLSPYKDVKALVTVERGSILSHRVITIDSNAYTIDIPVTADMLPNAFVSVLLVRKELPNEPADFKMGYQSLAVNTESKNLFITLTSDKQRYKPGDTVELTLVAENEQRERVPSAEISLAVVDESVLALKGNPKKDPLGFFYARHGLGVTTVSTLIKKLERANINTTPGSKGGGGGGGSEPEFNYRGDFKDTAFWKAALITNKDGIARATFVLPDNLTSWNVEALGVTKDSMVGVSTLSFTSTQDVIVRALLPRFTRKGDTVTVGAMVHNFTSEPQKFKVSLAAKPGQIISTQERTTRIEPGASKKITWSVKIPTSPIESQLSVQIKAIAGSYKDGVEQKIPLLPYGTAEFSATMNVTDNSSFTELVQIPKEVDTTQGTLSIRTGATLATFIPESMEYLFMSPYESNESTVSTILPLMALKQMAQLPAFAKHVTYPVIKDVNNKEISLDDLVALTLQRLTNSQKYDGGWGYWQDSYESNPTFSAYILEGLASIRKAGYRVEQNLIDRGVSYLRDYMRGNKDIDPISKKKDTLWADNRAQYLYAMSEAGQGDLALLLSLWDEQKLLSTHGKTLFLLASQNEKNRIGVSNATTAKLERIQKDIQKTLEGRARIDTRGTYIARDAAIQSPLCANDTQLTALTLRALTRTNPSHPLVPKIITWLIKTRHGGYWENTLTTATAISTLTEYLTLTKELEASYTGVITLNATKLKPFTVDESNVLKSTETTLPLSTLKKDNEVNTVIFTKDGIGKLYYEMLLSYYLPVDNLEARGNGMSIERAYYKLGDKEMKTPVVRTTQGETLIGKITLAVPEERSFVAVNVPLPAGLELVNFDLATSNQLFARHENSSYDAQSIPSCWCGGEFWEHKELRDDRLFLFSEHLRPGVYEYTYVVQVTTPGAFAHPPAEVHETYFPENGGRTAGEYFFVGD